MRGSVRVRVECLYLNINDWDPNRAGFPNDNNAKVDMANGKREYLYLL